MKEEKEKLGKEEKEKDKGVVTRTVKLIYGEDIRWAQLPVNCGISFSLGRKCARRSLR